MIQFQGWVENRKNVIAGFGVHDTDLFLPRRVLSLTIGLWLVRRASWKGGICSWLSVHGAILNGIST